MENRPEPHKSRRKNSQPVRSKADPSLQPPEDSEALSSTVATQATVPEIPNAPSVTARSTMTTAEREKIMKDFLDMLDPSVKPSDGFAQMAEHLRKQEEASPLTPLIIPPRPSELQETTTAAAGREGDAPTIPTSVTDPQHAEEMEYTMDEVLEAAERAEQGSDAEHDAGEGVITEGNASENEKMPEEGDDTAGKDLETIMDVGMTVDGGAVSKPSVTDAEGETPVFDSEGEILGVDIKGATPGSVVSERETLDNIENGNPVKDVSEGDTPVKTVSEGKPLG